VSKDSLQRFPDNFLWGTAIAAHQVEGNNKYSDFWHWEKSKKSYPNSDLACNHYELYKKDFDLAKSVLHNNSIRISLEWARLEPEEGKFDKKEAKHYQDVLAYLKTIGLKSCVTLHHFTNPFWFAKRGGWQKRGNLKYFLRYAKFCVDNFGDLIDYWIIINEPNVYISNAFLLGIWSPGKKDPLAALKVYLNMARAHSKTYKIIHSSFPQAKVSSSIAMVCFKSLDLLGKPLVPLFSWFGNKSFLFLTRGAHDFIGINYYSIHIVKFADFRLKDVNRSALEKAVFRKSSDLGWPFYPQGIYEVCKSTWNKYKLPIIITENGVADKADKDRPGFIVDHLSWLLTAIKEGVEILGYFHWTLMDNIEWHLGKKAKFGLFETNFKTLARIPRKSALLYGQICKNNSLKEDLLKGFNSG
jgi:beta-glucosidase